MPHLPPGHFVPDAYRDENGHWKIGGAHFVEDRHLPEHLPRAEPMPAPNHVGALVIMAVGAAMALGLITLVLDRVMR
jgi:hypothetical protein